MNEAFWTHTFEILVMVVVAFLLGLWLGYFLWNRWRQEYLAKNSSHEILLNRHKKLEIDYSDIKARLAKCEEDCGGSSVAAAPVSTPDPEDLKKIEGIGPKIEKLCNGVGIYTWRQLADTSVQTLQAMLDDAGPSYSVADPSTWPAQAEMAADGKWDDLKEYQDYLDGGRDPARSKD